MELLHNGDSVRDRCMHGASNKRRKVDIKTFLLLTLSNIAQKLTFEFLYSLIYTSSKKQHRCSG